MIKQNLQRALLLTIGSLTLTLAVGRCGPIAPSIAKRSLGNDLTNGLTRTDGSSGVSSGSDTVVEKDEVVVSKPELVTSTTSKEVASEEGSSFQSASESNESEIKAEIMGVMLRELRDSGKLTVLLPGGRGFLHVKTKMTFHLKDTEMKAHQLDQLELVFERKTDQTGILRVRSKSPEALKAVQDSLTAVNFTASLHSFRQESNKMETLTTEKEERSISP